MTAFSILRCLGVMSCACIRSPHASSLFSTLMKRVLNPQKSLLGNITPVVKGICHASRASESEKLNDQLIRHQEPSRCDLHPPLFQAEDSVIQQAHHPIRGAEVINAQRLFERLQV